MNTEHLIKKHHRLIWRLLSKHNADNLESLVRHMSGLTEASERKVLVDEIQRLAVPCMLKMDFRIFFDKLCQPFRFDGIEHYLDKGSIALFKSHLEQTTGIYTQAIYEHLSTSAKERYLEFQNRLASQGQTLPAIPLTLNRKQIADAHKPSDNVLKAGIFTQEPIGFAEKQLRMLSVEVGIISLEPESLIISTTHKEAVLCDVLYLYLYGYEKSYGIKSPIVIKCQQLDAHLQHDKSAHLVLSPLCDYVEGSSNNLETILKLKAQPEVAPNVSLMALYKSIEQRIHEHYFINQTSCLPLALTPTKQGWQPRAVYLAGHNEHLWFDFQTPSSENLLERIIASPKFQEKMTASRSSASFLVVPMKLNGNDELLAHELGEILADETLSYLYQGYVSNDKVRLLRFEFIRSRVGHDIYSPSILQGMAGGTLPMVNAHPTQQVTQILSNAHGMLTITEETALFKTLELGEPIRKSAPLRVPKGRLLKANVLKPKNDAPKVHMAVENHRETRTEDRFNFNTVVSIGHLGSMEDIKARTVNISAKGLCIEINEANNFFAGQIVQVTFDNLNAKLNANLIDQQYEIIYINGKNLHLTATGQVKDHLARKAMTKIIYQNLSKLKPSGSYEEIYGLSKAMRSVYCHNHLTIPLMLSRENHQNYIETILCNRFSAISNLNSSLETSLPSILAENKFSQFINELYVGLAANTPQVEGYLLILPNDNVGNRHRYFIQDVTEIIEKKNVREYINELTMTTKPSVLKVSLRHCSELSERYFADEMRYLKRIAPEMLAPLKSMITDLVAIGEISEVTHLFEQERQSAFAIQAEAQASYRA